MVIPRGYKETEIGILPNDWEIKKAIDCMQIETGSRNTEHKSEKGKYPFFVRSQEVERIDNFNFDCEAVLTAGDGVGTGKVFHYLKGKFDAHQRVYLMTNFVSLHGKYFYYYFSNNFYNEVAKYTAKSSVDSVRRNMIADMLIPIPDISEQTAIAEALSDVDSLMASLEKLIAKKKVIKQGVMQELLTGKKRLQGFGGEWVVSEIEQVADIYDNLRIPIAESLRESGQIPYYGANGIQDYVKGHTHNGEFVLVAEDGANDLTNYPVRYVNGKIWVNNHAHVLQGKAGKADTRFLAYAMSMLDYQAILVGGTRAKLNGSVLKKISISLPDKSEQMAIASIFSDMDSEIEQLEKKLTKYQKIKLGMMQELLTGRIRLVEPKTQAESNNMAESAPKEHSKYDDAVAISAIVNAFYHKQYPLGRVKVQKLLYLLRRKQDANISDFKKKAAGPYNEKVRYNGGEAIAIKEGYITRESGAKGSRFGKGDKIDIALKYVVSMQDDIDWLLEQFQYYSTSKAENNLEVLATVDMAVCELDKAGKEISLNTVKNIISSSKEWAPKLKKACFSDKAILQAIDESGELFD